MMDGARAVLTSAFGGDLNGWTQHFILEGKDGVDSYETRTGPGF
jgi:hypothetical protein